MNITDIRLYRRLRGGLWVNRTGHGWHQANNRYYDLCLRNRGVYSCMATEDNRVYDGLWPLAILSVSLTACIAFLWAVV